MKVAIIGATGQLGFELQRTAPLGVELLPLGRAQLDMQTVTTEVFVENLSAVDVIINASAYTAVDKAESEPEVAFQINAEAVGLLAAFAANNKKPLIHVSTDFVFDGESATPYQLDDNKDPQSVYGASKAKGEDLLFEHYPEASCIRTSWVYSTHGNNFVKTMLRLMNERDSLGVVADQIGSPTYAYDLALFIWQLLDKPVNGLLHFSNEGICSWYDFAAAIYVLGKQKGLVQSDCTISPIATSDYPTPAKRPSYSLLDKQDTKNKTQATIPHWLESLNNMMDQLDK